MVMVKPIDKNDNEPFFPQDKLQMSVLENKPPGMFAAECEKRVFMLYTKSKGPKSYAIYKE